MRERGQFPHATETWPCGLGAGVKEREHILAPALAVEPAGSGGLCPLRLRFYMVPEIEEIFRLPEKIFLACPLGGRPDYKSDIFRQFQLLDDLSYPVPLLAGLYPFR